MMIDNKEKLFVYILESWATTKNPFNSTKDLLAWLEEMNTHAKVNIQKLPYQYDGFWHYDKEALGIVNDQNSYFQIKGIRLKHEEGILEQPIIVQDGIGYLGIITKVIDGVLYFLMQAKLEPGNINGYQISPTIQATKSNFTRVHGGKEPAFYRYFANKENYMIIADQIQSEQSSRFLGKRNRNIILCVEEEMEIPPTHKWMTLGQIKELMHHDNLINMDARSVISCIPFAMRNLSNELLERVRPLFKEPSFFQSMFYGDSAQSLIDIYQYMNDFKMLKTYEKELIDLNSVKGWKFENGEYISDHSSFKIIYCDIEIEGREVQHWQQPLLEAIGMSEFGLIYRKHSDGVMQFLVQAKSEVGCFDKIEIAPSIQKEPIDQRIENEVDQIFFDQLEKQKGIALRTVLSEEGGRFYHEENYNTIMEIEDDALTSLPSGYFWVDFQTLNTLIQFNNCLNIQLRNLISLLNL
ncbi:MAG: NDP-hexose 2,3-dehydratase family protein [Solobacterium sp.]|nr:NDP-hexose 2,3-dehydratase family protein [Solobacterium sp.]